MSIASNERPQGHVTSILGADLDDAPSINPEFDIRGENRPLQPPTPMGPTYAVQVQEILRRGFITLNAEEQAQVVAAYLATQSQALSPFKTPLEEQIMLEKNALEVDTAKKRNVSRLVLMGFTILIVATVIGMLLVTVLKQGVLTDSGVTQGIFNMAQEFIRVIFSPGSY
jgi:hypothetical protein